MAATAINRGFDTSFFEKAKGMLQSFGSQLMGTTSHTAPSKLANPFAGKNWGAHAASGVREAGIQKTLAKTDGWTVKNAKELLENVLDGRLVSATFGQIVSELKAHKVNIETRIKNGIGYNILRHEHRSGTVPAKSVHKSLGYNETLRKVLLEATGLSTDDNKNIRQIPAQGYQGWSNFFFKLNTLTIKDGNKREISPGFTISNGVGYLGQVFVDSTDARSLEEIVKVAMDRKLDLVLPTKDGTLASPRIIGLPVLVKVASMEAHKVHPGLSVAALSKSWKSYEEHVEKLSTRADSVLGATSVKSAADTANFMSKFVKKDATPVVEMAAHADDLDNSFGAGFASEEVMNEAALEEKRHLSIRMIDNHPVVYDHDLNELIPEMSVTEMLEDKYELANEDGNVFGYAVKDEKSIKFFDAEGNVYQPNRVIAGHTYVEDDAEDENDNNSARKMGR